MSDNRPQFIPHPLCSSDAKLHKQFISDSQKFGLETIQEYVKNSSDPRWAASHLVRAIARGLGLDGSSVDVSNASKLNEIANSLTEKIR